MSWRRFVCVYAWFRVECGITFYDGLFAVDMSLFGRNCGGLSFSLFCDTGHDS